MDPECGRPLKSMRFLLVRPEPHAGADVRGWRYHYSHGLGLGLRFRLLPNPMAGGHGPSSHWLHSIDHLGSLECPARSQILCMFATYLSLATAPPIFAWMSDLSPHDAEQRAFVLGFSIAFYYAVGAWSNVLIWPASQVPHYRVAWQCSIALWALVIVLLCALRYTELKFIRPRNRRIAEENYDEAADLPQPSGKDIDAKDAALDRVTSVGTAKHYV